MIQDPLRVAAAYSGNPDGQPIYPNKIDHGYDKAIQGDTAVMQQLVEDLRHEQGNPKKSSVERVLEKFSALSARSGWLELTRAIKGKKRAKKRGNEIESLIGSFRDTTVRLNLFNDFITVDMFLGEVISERVPKASGGVLHASGGWSKNPYDWRFSGVFPNSRRLAFDEKQQVDPNQVLQRLYSLRSKVGDVREEEAPQGDTAQSVAREFARSLKKMKFPKSWMNFKVKVDGDNIDAVHGSIPRQFRHPRDYGYADEFEVPEWDLYAKWEDFLETILEDYQRKYPQFDFGAFASY